MRTLSRFLSAVQLKHVVAVLLLGVFAGPVSAAVRWVGVIALDLERVPALSGLLVSGLVFAAEASVIYLALRGLSWLFGRVADVPSLAGRCQNSNEFDDSDPAMSLATTARTSPDPAAWPEEGGDHGRV